MRVFTHDRAGAGFHLSSCFTCSMLQLLKIMSPAPWNCDPPVLLIENDKFKTIPMRPSPIVHPAVDAPICPECQALEMTFFNPECKGCQNELETMAHHGIGIASIFAILRQWIPQVSFYCYSTIISPFVPPQI